MTDRELDDIIHEALVVLNTPAYLELPDEPFPTSEKFERRMARLLADPKRYAKRWRRAARPMWRKALSAAAAVLLVLSVSLGGLMAVSPTARAWVERVVVEWLEEYVGISFHGSAERKADWYPAYLPDGYREVNAEDIAGYGTITFENDGGDILYFDYQPALEENEFNVDREHSIYRETTLNGHKAYLFEAKTEDKNTYLVWTSQDETTAFLLEGRMDAGTLFNIANRVEKNK